MARWSRWPSMPKGDTPSTGSIMACRPLSNVIFAPTVTRTVCLDTAKGDTGGDTDFHCVEAHSLLCASLTHQRTMVKMLHIFIRQHGFKRPALQIQVQHILGGKSGSGQPGDKQFVDEAITLLPDLVGRGCAGMTGYNQSHARSSSREGDVRAIVQGPQGSTFRMGTDYSGRARQHGLNFCQIQERIIAAPCNEAQTC